MKKITPIILSGGKGTRLWPESRMSHPKQYKNIVSEQSLLEETISRINKTIINNLIIISNKNDLFYIKDSLNKLDQEAKIILEPFGKNTAPAIAAAAHILDRDEIVLILSSDHFIQNIEEFNSKILEAQKLVKDGHIVTFGIKPRNPNTGYGYIKKGTKINNGYAVEEFKEKPIKETAVSYLEDGNYFWNSGIFMFRAGDYLDELKVFREDIFKATENTILKSIESNNCLTLDEQAFALCPSDSIDYAVLEKTSKIAMVECNMHWTDVGTWSSVHEVVAKDKAHNTIEKNTLIINSKNNYVRSSNKLIALLGVDDLIVVDTPDALLVTNHENSQNVGKIVDELKILEREEANLGREVHRPWGKYDSVDSGIGFQVKRITVKPKQKLSVQMHYHRSEHWVVVSGIARVHYGDNFHDLKVNESTYHDKEVIHALENPGEEILILIEVQVGGYLGEDDIVRYEDIYGRV